MARTEHPDDTGRPPSAPARRRRITPIAMTSVIAGIALFAIAGCGSASPTTSTDLTGGGQPVNSIANAAFRYATCMRDHGVSNFPAPQVHVSPNQVKISQMVPSSLVRSPQFKAAQKACRSIMPGPGNQSAAQLSAQRHAREQDLLAFAQCLRAHGITSFPDPTPQGQLTLQMVTAAGVDLHAPSLLTAGKACTGVTHGTITPADVERAVNGTS